MKIILASQSPRRKQLLEQAAIDFDIMVSHTDESYPVEMAMEAIPVFIAKQKALVVQKLADKNAIIIGADTIVVIDNKILGKPKDAADALEILQQLNSRTHQVITGVCILQNEIEKSFYDITEVSFNTLTTAQLEFYINKYKPYDKAGAYAIQEWIGVVGIKKIDGCFYNVMGLPVSKVLKVLGELGK